MTSFDYYKEFTFLNRDRLKRSCLFESNGLDLILYSVYDEDNIDLLKLPKKTAIKAINLMVVYDSEFDEVRSVI